MAAASVSKLPTHSRKIRKPLMEKRRRARINQSLNELKRLILDGNTNKKETIFLLASCACSQEKKLYLRQDLFQGSKPAKLEKADILEMTVQHLRKLHKEKESEPMLHSLQRNPKFRAGFSECAREAQELLSKLEGIDPAVSDRLSKHLASCLDNKPERQAVLTLLPTKLHNGNFAFVIPVNLNSTVAACVNLPHKEVELQEDLVWRPW